RAAVGLPAEDQARADQCTIQVHGARATLALLARVLGPVQAESLAEHVEETLAAPHIVGDTLLPVDGAADPQSPSRALRAPPPHEWGGVAHAQARQRRAMTASAWRRYAAVPRTSSMGRAAAATSSPNRVTVASLGGRRPSQSSSPWIKVSASTARSGVGPAEPIPVPTRRFSRWMARPKEHTA